MNPEPEISTDITDAARLRFMWDEGLFVHRYQSGWAVSKPGPYLARDIKAFASNPREALDNAIRGVELDVEGITEISGKLLEGTMD